MALIAVESERRGEVGWIKIKPVQDTIEASVGEKDYTEVHIAIALALEEFRNDSTTRVIVITGQRDGEFHVAPRPAHYDVKAHCDRLNPIGRVDKLPTKPNRGVSRTIEALALCEIPVIARLNGDAIGFGQSIMFGCDIIIAREDAVISDVHLGQGDVVDHNGERRGFPWAVTPGDGALTFLPFFLTPAIMKEYLFLSRSFTAAQFAAMNIINYAVPLPALDAKVDLIVGELLKRPSFALARTKRACNKHIVAQMNLVTEHAHESEMRDFVDHARLGGMDRLTPR
jgi:enoyl-CoA hydratase